MGYALFFAPAPSVPFALAILTNADADADEAVDFQREVLPILSNRCFACHGPDEGARQADLRLDLRDPAIAKQAIVPGSAADSGILARVRSSDPDMLMPPPDAKQSLTPDEVDVLRRWIDAGAEYTPHWAFQSPRKPAMPSGDDPWIINDIDRFVLARLESRGLRPSEPASRETLIRRVTLDLTGLLPSRDEVDSFVNDESPDAYERLVDRLLASPHYGERMARRWLDLARYADSNGYTVDGPRSIWPYRDWVINALNDDMPFDTFTIHQLAGDLISESDIASQVATGFHRNTGYNEEGGADPEQFRVERTINRVNTTGTVWLGLTVACAQCHSHKFDPISQHEYFRLYAFLDSVEEPSIRVTTPDAEAALAKLNASIRDVEARSAVALEMALRSVGPVPSLLDWRVLALHDEPVTRGSTLRVLGDASILAEGDNPEIDEYEVTFDLPEGLPTALRLEALTHESLPRNGPGRAGNGNFVLAQFEVSIDGTAVPIQRAIADHEQAGYPISDSWDGDQTSGWAINVASGSMNQDREAIFHLDYTDIDLENASTLTIRMRSYDQPQSRGYNLGRFRWSATINAVPRMLVPTSVATALNTPGDARSDEQEAMVRSFVAVDDPSVSALHDELDALRSERDMVTRGLPTTLVMRDRMQPRESFVHVRGDFLRRGDVVEPGTPDVFPPMTVDSERATREDLARWLVSGDHPLTGRVVTNRMWQHFFGTGLVETENDFGIQGARPTHPNLLDWLATEFVDRGWSMKAMHRLIVTSATYRQASAFRADAEAIDPINTWLHRQNRLRLDAETIRDAGLCASGLLSSQIGGPGVFPPQPDGVFAFTQSAKSWPTSEGDSRFRRGMYTYIWRQSQHPLLTTFDGPDAQEACTRRDRSNTPMQALLLANDAAFVEFAQAFGRRIEASASEDSARIDAAYRMAMGRGATDAERSRLLQFLKLRRASFGADHEAATLFAGGPESMTPAETASWVAVARVILNLDEFITRE